MLRSLWVFTSRFIDFTSIVRNKIKRGERIEIAKQEGIKQESNRRAVWLEGVGIFYKQQNSFFLSCKIYRHSIASAPFDVDHQPSDWIFYSAPWWTVFPLSILYDNSSAMANRARFLKVILSHSNIPIGLGSLIYTIPDYILSTWNRSAEVAIVDQKYINLIDWSQQAGWFKKKNMKRIRQFSTSPKGWK